MEGAAGREAVEVRRVSLELMEAFPQMTGSVFALLATFVNELWIQGSVGVCLIVLGRMGARSLSSQVSISLQ